MLTPTGALPHGSAPVALSTIPPQKKAPTARLKERRLSTAGHQHPPPARTAGHPHPRLPGPCTPPCAPRTHNAPCAQPLSLPFTRHRYRSSSTDNRLSLPQPRLSPTAGPGFPLAPAPPFPLCRAFFCNIIAGMGKIFGWYKNFLYLCTAKQQGHPARLQQHHQWRGG